MELAVYNTAGQDTGRKVTLQDSIFGVEPNDHCIYLDVKQYLANQRQGTAKSKQRNEVSGSTRKLKRQKGTGTARAGSIKSPLFVGGGRVFGPVPRDYSFKLNKKTKLVARKSALAYKVKANAISVIENFSFEAPKTKAFTSIISSLKVADHKLLFVVTDVNPVVALSARNLPNVKVVRASDLNTYDVMNAQSLLVTEGSFEVINRIFGIS
ncbi:50S ribosomal protein L4 [Alistipes sp. ZOR0009]|jgi:large subunit ribosomal protein L4|uniref:50S ribosomal protein L4 n=1 Tax=Alistipes sp. ZOR0009 TaxID=1339253 RepID=UPI0006487065|nr:50S ribosomal protein L4 [Alistipes sp. ZOR0009]